VKRLLVANRGEIAVRIIRAARDLGISTVAVHSTADAEARHVRMADAAVEIGPPPAGKSYLVVDAILDAARSAGADAVHPGYGFLSENAEFAQAVLDAELTWIGPPPHANLANTNIIRHAGRYLALFEAGVADLGDRLHAAIIARGLRRRGRGAGSGRALCRTRA